MTTVVKDKIVSSDTNKPGSLAVAVVQEMKEDVFKKPFPVSGKKRKMNVLDEESYLEVGWIIYFN